MGLFDFIKKEADDVNKVVDRARERIDAALTEAEAELEMTPAEKLRALQRKGRQTDEAFDRIADKVAEQTAPEPPPSLDEAPEVTSIVLSDGSVRSGNDVPPEPEELEPEQPEDTGPAAGGLDWVAPRPGEEAVVPKFGGTGPVAEGDPAASPEPEATHEASPAEAPAPVHAVPLDEGQPEPTPAMAAPPADVAAPAAPVGSPSPAAPDSSLADLPAPPTQAPAAEIPPVPEPLPPRAPEPEPMPESKLPSIDEILGTSTGESPAEIAARVVAELEAAVEEPAVTEPAPVDAPPEPQFEKTPAQLKYEKAREAADALLEELRGELRSEGEI